MEDDDETENFDDNLDIPSINFEYDIDLIDQTIVKSQYLVYMEEFSNIYNYMYEFNSYYTNNKFYDSLLINDFTKLSEYDDYELYLYMNIIIYYVVMKS